MACNQDQTRKLIWPIAGILSGLVAAIIPSHLEISPRIVIAAWAAGMALVLVLSSHPIGARVGVIAAGLLLTLPCFIRDSPLTRGGLICAMFIPFVAASAFVTAPPITGYRSRLAYLCTWGGTQKVTARSASFDKASLVRLLVAALFLATMLQVVIAAPASGSWFLVRWLAGGFAIFAFAEMLTASLPLMSAAFCLTVPPLMHSPYLSASIAEFWTRRWNLFASKIVFRPFCFSPLARSGAFFAMSIAFLVSGIAHALLAFATLGQWRLSLLCGAFFLAQPLLILIERSLGVRRWRPAPGRIWTFLALAITSPLFVEPVLQIIEQSWGEPAHALEPTLVVLIFVLAFSTILSLASLSACSLPARASPSDQQIRDLPGT